MAGALRKHPVYKTYQDVRRSRDRMSVYLAHHVEPDTDRHNKVSNVIRKLDSLYDDLSELNEDTD